MQKNNQDSRVNPGTPRYPFAGIPSFLRADICTDLERLDADIAVMGVPTDKGSPYIPGAPFGPRGPQHHATVSAKRERRDQRTGPGGGPGVLLSSGNWH